MEEPKLSPGVAKNQATKNVNTTEIYPAVNTSPETETSPVKQPLKQDLSAKPEIATNQAPQEDEQKQNIPKQEIGKKKGPDKNDKGLKKEISIFRVSLNEKAFLAKHLATILKAGISLPESLQIIQKQSHGKLKNILSDVIAKVEAGKALNVAFSDHKKTFDPLFINMIKVGEKSGSLDQSLHYLSAQLSKDAKLISKVKSAAMYPTIVLVTAVVVGGGVSYFILPKLAKLFSSFKADLPFATKLLLKISYSIEHFGIFWLGGIFGSFVLFLLLLKIPIFKAIWDWIKLHTPIAGKLIKSLNLARFSLTFGTLLKSGVAIDDALKITKDSIGSVSYKKLVSRVFEDVSKGKTVVEGLDDADPKEKLFPTTARAMIKVGETTGSLNESLLYISEFYEEEVDNITKDLSTSLEPILLIFIAFIVAFVAVAIISPMYQILGVIK